MNNEHTGRSGQCCGSYKGIPKGILAVCPFDINKYLGHWFEIARMDFRFERGLNNTSAHYSLRRNGKIKVVNRGFDYGKGFWKQSTGKAKFAGAEEVAMLRVSFFGPFYAGYNVIALDPDYQHALVCGKNFDYLWILSRGKSLPEEVRKDYLKRARDLGFRTEDLIWVAHDREDPLYSASIH